MVWHCINGLFDIYSKNASNWTLMATNMAFYLRMYGKTLIHRWNHNGRSSYCIRLQIVIF